MMNRIAFNAIVRAARVNPTIRSAAPYRWQSTQTAAKPSTQTAAKPASSTAAKPAPPTAANPPAQGSNFSAGLAGGLTVLVGGFAWYHFSGTRGLVNATRDSVKKAQELKEKVKNAGDSAEGATETVKYLRSASTTLIPGSAPFLGKVFDQIEEISKEHGDEVKKIFDETYNDFEKLTKEGGFDPQTATKAIDILQKRVKEIHELAGDIGGDVYNKLISENPQLKDKISEPYKALKDVAGKAKDKKPEVQKLLKDTATELTKLFKDNGVSDKSINKAQDLLKKKAEEAKKIVEDVSKDAKKK